jgi:hypothetical protein
MKTQGGWKFSYAVASMLIAVSANGAEQWATSNVKFVYPLADGNFVLALHTDPSGCPASGNPKYLYVTVGQNGVTADGVKAMFATSLTAISTGKQLSIAFSDSTAACYVNRLVILD